MISPSRYWRRRERAKIVEELTAHVAEKPEQKAASKQERQAALELMIRVLLVLFADSKFLEEHRDYILHG